VFSRRANTAEQLRGAFFCFALPALDKELGVFTEEAGTTRWYLYDRAREAVLEEPAEMLASIRSDATAPRVCASTEAELLDMRRAVQKHIKNTYLKTVDAPQGVRPRLLCWLDLSETA
jgi:hypothetical protein